MITKEYNVLGTIIQLRIYDTGDEWAIKEAIERLNEIDDRMSAYKNTSFISKINNNAGGSSQEVTRDVYYVIERAVQYASYDYQDLLKGSRAIQIMSAKGCTQLYKTNHLKNKKLI